MPRICKTFSTQSKIERPYTLPRSTSRVSAIAHSLFKETLSFIATEKPEKSTPAASALKSIEIGQFVQEIVQIDKEITALREKGASSTTLEPFIQKRAQALEKLTDLVSRAKPNDLAGGCTSMPKEILESAMAILKEAKADIPSILLFLLKEQKLPEYKDIINATFGFNIPTIIINAQRNALHDEIRKHNYKKVATIMENTYSMPSKTLKINKKDAETIAKGLLQQSINERLGSAENYFLLTTKFQKIKNQTDIQLELFCETARDLLLAGNQTNYERLERSVLKSSAPQELKDKFLSAAKEIPEKQAIAAIKTNLKAGNTALVKVLLTHNPNAAMEVYVELAERGEIEQCAQLLFFARECHMSITALMYLTEKSSGAKQTNELAIARDKQLNGTLSTTSRQNLIHNRALSSRDLIRTLGDLDHLEMVSLARREGAARVVQTVFEHSPQNTKAKLLRFMGKWENNAELLKELALSGNEALCKLAIDSHFPFQDKQVLLQMRTDILETHPQNYKQGASLLARIAANGVVA